MRKMLCIVVFAVSFVACEDKPLVEQAPLSPVVVEQVEAPTPIAPAAAAESAGDAGSGS